MLGNLSFISKLLIILATVFVTGGGGVAIGYFLRKKIAQAEINSLEAKADHILTEAKNKQQTIVLEAKEKAAKMLDEVKREESRLRQEVQAEKQRLEKRENMFDQKV